MTDNISGLFTYIFAGSVPLNVKIHSMLEAELDFVTLDPAPEWVTPDCAVVVKIKKRDLGRAKKILENSNISNIEYFV